MSAAQRSEHVSAAVRFFVGGWSHKTRRVQVSESEEERGPTLQNRQNGGNENIGRKQRQLRNCHNLAPQPRPHCPHTTAAAANTNTNTNPNTNPTTTANNNINEDGRDDNNDIIIIINDGNNNGRCRQRPTAFTVLDLVFIFQLSGESLHMERPGPGEVFFCLSPKSVGDQVIGFGDVSAETGGSGGFHAGYIFQTRSCDVWPVPTFWDGSADDAGDEPLQRTQRWAFSVFQLLKLQGCVTFFYLSLRYFFCFTLSK